MGRLIFFVALAATMWLMVYFRRDRYGITVGKSTIVALAIVLGGIGGAYMLGFVESGRWGNISYYGSVFCVPLAMLPCIVTLKVPYKTLLDYCAPCGSAAVVVAKLNCFLQGCCRGKTVWIGGKALIFPSQLAELGAAFIITEFLLCLERGKKYESRRYAVFLIAYGVARFGLNFFRAGTARWAGLPLGNWWSILSVMVGLTWITKIYNLQCKKPKNELR